MGGSIPGQIFFLKNRDPENWKDRVPEGMGSVDAPTPKSVKVTIVDGRKKAAA